MQSLLKSDYGKQMGGSLNMKLVDFLMLSLMISQ